MDSCKLGTCDALKQAEARVRELEVQSCEALAGAHAEQEVSRHWKEEAEYQKTRVRELERDNAGRFEHIIKVEAERDALREALTEIVCISDYEMYDECSLGDCHKLAQAALAAREVKP